MPSETPNFILRGARFATIGVSRPTRSSGRYADLMPANTVRWRPSPTSSVSRTSLSAPSTASAATMRAMRRSTLAKSSMAIVAGVPASPLAPAPATADADADGGVVANTVGFALPPECAVSALPAADRTVAFGPSSSASICFGSMRCIRCLNGRTACGVAPGIAPRELAVEAEELPRDAARQPGSTGASITVRSWKPCSACEQTVCSRSRADGSFASTHGSAASKASLRRSAMRIASRSTRPNSRTS